MKVATLSAEREERTMDDDNAPPPTLAISGTNARWWKWLVPAALFLVATVAFVANSRHDADADAGAEARSTVTTHVEELLSYDYREIDDDLQREKGWLTGSFADDYESLVTEKIGPAAEKAKVVTDAKVTASGVISTGHDKVDLLLFVDVTTRSSELADPRVSGSRLVVTAEQVDGQWRISDLEPI